MASAVPWIVGAVVHDDARGVLWTAALIIDYVAARLGWPLPGRGRSPASSWTVTGEHLAERYQQFIIIALGEMIIISGFGFSMSEFAGAQWVAFAITFSSTVLLWRIYFYRAGTVLVEAVAGSARPGRLAESATYTHLVMVAGIVAAAVGYEIVIAHPGGHTDPAWLTVIVGVRRSSCWAGRVSSTRCSAGCPGPGWSASSSWWRCCPWSSGCLRWRSARRPRGCWLFVAGAFLASASWQLLVAGGGT
ncbi:low temperature requirement protein A, partial [Micromonospora sp. ATA51]|nr:low temperature requirement protein A [Micromonospora sp. ATA51]